MPESLEILKDGSIIMFDLVTKENIDLEKKLETIANKFDEKETDWRILSLPLKNTTEWTISTIPGKIEFFETITITASTHSFYPVKTVIIKGKISKLALKELVSLSPNESYERIQQIRKDFWNYWKETIHKEISVYPHETCSNGIIHFVFSASQESTLKTILGEIPKTDHIRANELVRKFGINTLGLMSLYRIFSNTVTILGQGNAVYSDGGLDFSWITILGLYDPSAGKGFTDQTIAHLLDFQITLEWLEYRRRQIPLWQSKIDDISKEIEKIEKNLKELDASDIDHKLFSGKGLFLIDFAKNSAEQRYIKNKIEEIKNQYDNISNKELPVTGEVVQTEKGLLWEMYITVENMINKIFNEYSFLNEQYDILSTYLSEQISIINIQSSNKLSKSNKILQIVITGMTAVLLILTGILAFKPT